VESSAIMQLERKVTNRQYKKTRARTTGCNTPLCLMPRRASHLAGEWGQWDGTCNPTLPVQRTPGRMPLAQGFAGTIHTMYTLRSSSAAFMPSK
jgi:hypothetical protein